jgi:hypothetical protein
MAALYTLSAHGASQRMRFEGVRDGTLFAAVSVLAEFAYTHRSRVENLALRWRAYGNEPTITSITVMAAHLDLYW